MRVDMYKVKTFDDQETEEHSFGSTVMSEANLAQ